jgi:hypothetical protein
MVFQRDDLQAQRLGLGAAALRYLKLGYAVLPLVRGGKKPHRMLPETGGVHHGTTWPSQVWEWWKQDNAANVGIACGPKSQLVVIDLDVKRGQQGPYNFGTFIVGRGWPDGPYVKTPSGGVHLWVRTAEPIPERPGILPGVDVKSAGGLVVAPPSMSLHHPGSQPGDAPSGVIPLPYMWEGCPCQVPPAPAWLAEWTHTAPTAGSPNELAGEPVADVEELKRTGVEAGVRNDTFYKLACSLYRRFGTGMDGAQRALDELSEVYHATDKNGFSYNELLTIANSARRFITESAERDEAVRRSWLARNQQ